MAQADSHNTAPRAGAADIARLLDGYRSAVDRHDATERAFRTAQRLFLRILDRRYLSEDASYKAAGAGVADVVNLDAYQFERAALRRLMAGSDGADEWTWYSSAAL